MGPPDWDALLSSVVRQHPDERVDAYFCGPPALAAKVRETCRKLGISFKEERF
jgi:NAD(P)H-flavin reductase